MFAHIRDDDEHLVRLSGQIDLENAGQLLHRLIQLTAPAPEHFTLDLTAVTFLDCSGLRTLLAFDRHLTSAGGSMQVGAVSPAAGRLLELLTPCGLPSRFLPQNRVTCSAGV